MPTPLGINMSLLAEAVAEAVMGTVGDISVGMYQWYRWNVL